MTRLAVMSDLHLEFERPGRVSLPVERAIDIDLIILAGDTHTRRRGPAWAARTFQNLPVVMIGGNHEAYGDSLWANIAAHRRLADRLGALPDGRQHVVYLEREMVLIGKVRILGATLWTDFALFGTDRHDDAMAAARQDANDYRRIQRKPTKQECWDLRPPRLDPQDTGAIHALTCSWLNRQLETPHPGPTVVVTHHAPSPRSLPLDWQGDLLMAAYASDLEATILNYEPCLWVHGHIHQSRDYRIGRTRVVANPRGYVGSEENPAFIWGKTFEIS